ncbi:hypothetical protein BT96DRAFT_1003147 [Gymnopus androsaceus JB14]|uniref:Uncharacterized protein n=1 Tax=Gymnopus androsaceus JB14 TaxID=1447944 RepID=A0A6A4GWT6_9AGAR|nr:hypothetical protein BT96DRAFT_1003147 [Gymnopus androsaceus JB14]
MATNHHLVLNTDGIHPRVNGALLPCFIDCFVVLPSEVIQHSPDTRALVVEACDGISVSVDLERLPQDLTVTRFIEVLGQVYCNAGMIRTITVLAIRVINLGNEFDLSLVDRILKLIHDRRFDDVFNPLSMQRLNSPFHFLHLKLFDTGSMSTPLRISDIDE